ncbi:MULTISPECIES: helix-turn-helix domain-containing protein [Providencia]|uniref:DNA-binding helix-turn-helix protein n=2 Tax=Providencia rustigianii TaxID=158850 RepID=D1NZ39_9GAMM|nr:MULTISPECIES: helix-turn-helix transcriptional regulator [Providencia]EFB73737.1 DNA-binding helix-turn-helix protein [Providencia rustigianii DSM 4541]MTC57397.1 helix-turn-helix domain-containing protein [Providencia rustigianii]SPY77524.1 transcriptional repressor DicA [Providencia rustigianii]SUC26922.1 transcriptional repressor DicA [Providencia rustigianii]SUC35513.1 transcriptional repressor DicA [Providencia rustigianii]
MDIHSIIGTRIKNRRKELGLSGANLASKLNLSQQQISRYENGINKIPIDHLLDIADILMCPIEWFFKGYKNEDNDNEQVPFDITNKELQYAAESVIVSTKHQI